MTVAEGASARTDPIQVEVLRHAFISAAEEMKINLARTAYNPIIYEVLDFSCGIFDRRCRTIAQADGLPSFLGNLGIAVECVVRDIGGLDRMRPGDVYLINDPYEQGMHINDVTTVEPVFHAGEPVAFAATRAHWLDIGAIDPGGSITTTDAVQEGLWLRSVRLYREGELDESVWRAIRHNVRLPESMMGDLRAQVAASRTGVLRMGEVVARHGMDAVESAIDAIIVQGERRTRAAIAAMRDGTYETEAALDDDCLGNGPIPIRVRVTIDDDEMEVDLTGSAPPNRGPVNSPYASTLCACRIALKAFTNPDRPATEGDFAPLRLVVPEDSMFNARYPAPTFMISNTRVILVDLLVRALSDAVPEQAMAGHYGNLFGFTVFGDDPGSGRLYVQQEPQYGGWGATRERDGESVMIFMTNAGCRVLSAEALEGRFPLRLERHELRRDSGGPGRWRGGLGSVRDYRVLGHEARMMVITDRRTCPPWGIDGGGTAMHCTSVVEPEGGPPAEVAKAQARPVPAGGLISLRTGGGGGCGDPFERDVELVRRDVVAGYVSAEAARSAYGVAVDPNTLTVDSEATARLRDRGEGG